MPVLGAGALSNENIDDRVSALLVAGSNITKIYDDTANTLTLAASGGLDPADIDTDATRIGLAVETTTSATFVDLATVGPQCVVDIGSSGRALVVISSYLRTTAATGAAVMGFAVSGASTVAASQNYSIQSVGTNAFRLSSTFPVTGLTPGSTTFTAKYLRGTTGTAEFADRFMVVIPL